MYRVVDQDVPRDDAVPTEVSTTVNRIHTLMIYK